MDIKQTILLAEVGKEYICNLVNFMCVKVLWIAKLTTFRELSYIGCVNNACLLTNHG